MFRSREAEIINQWRLTRYMATENWVSICPLMASCLLASTHHPVQCWLIISRVLPNSSWDKSTGNPYKGNHYNTSEYYTFQIKPLLAWTNELRLWLDFNKTVACYFAQQHFNVYHMIFYCLFRHCILPTISVVVTEEYYHWRLVFSSSEKRNTSSCQHLPTSANAVVQHIPRNMHTVFALLCFVVVIHWLIFPYPSGLLHWHCGNLTIAPVPAKQSWWIWINTSCEFIMNDCITTTKQSTTKPCAYFLRYTVYHGLRSSGTMNFPIYL